MKNHIEKDVGGRILVYAMMSMKNNQIPSSTMDDYGWFSIVVAFQKLLLIV